MILFMICMMPIVCWSSNNPCILARIAATDVVFARGGGREHHLCTLGWQLFGFIMARNRVHCLGIQRKHLLLSEDLTCVMKVCI